MTNEHGFNTVDCRQLSDNPFQLIGHDWALITAEKEGRANTMTVAWGGLGVMWGKPVIFVAVRPERYTYEFIEAANAFSLTFFNESFRKTLGHCGTVSGRDEDKIKKNNLTLLYDGTVPYFQECRMALICKNIMATTFKPEDLRDKDFVKFYGGGNDPSGLGGGYHTLYIAQISNALLKEGETVLPLPKKGKP
jgi:flavin reductase (DIM6/NTAB) family NADH-FMN oxidoreductase RutF